MAADRCTVVSTSRWYYTCVDNPRRVHTTSQCRLASFPLSMRCITAPLDTLGVSFEYLGGKVLIAAAVVLVYWRIKKFWKMNPTRARCA
eukprot:366223-Chlamydomonas_euryale.AAC.11